MAELIPASTKFTPLQQELLRLYSLDLGERELLEIKDMIGKYLLDNLVKKTGDAVEKKNITHDDFERWLNEKS
jgi:hypothetical protein